MNYSRVFILTSQSLFAQGVQSLLSGQPGIQVVGVATISPAVFAQVRAAAPDVVIIEATGEEQGLLVAQVLDSIPGVKVIGLSLDDNRIHIYYQQMKQGRRVEDLLEAISGSQDWRSRRPDGLRLFVLFQEHYGQRILENLRDSVPQTWTVEAWRAPSSLPLVVDDPVRFLPVYIPAADLVLSLGESPSVAQFVPSVVERTGARAVIEPVDNVAWLPDGQVRQLRARLRDQGVTAVFPKPFCSLTERSYNLGRREVSFEDPWIAEFARHFGQPVFQIECDGQQITKVEVTRDTACGCAQAVASQLIGADVREAKVQADQTHHYYPCLATMGVDPGLGASLVQVSCDLMREAVEVEVAPGLSRAAYRVPSEGDEAF